MNSEVRLHMAAHRTEQLSLCLLWMRRHDGVGPATVGHFLDSNAGKMKPLLLGSSFELLPLVAQLFQTYHSQWRAWSSGYLRQSHPKKKKISVPRNKIFNIIWYNGFNI